MKRLGSLLALAASLLFSLLGILLAYLSHARAVLPYNQQGIYFDGVATFKALCLALYRRFR